jgi:hypothetical protein
MITRQVGQPGSVRLNEMKPNIPLTLGPGGRHECVYLFSRRENPILFACLRCIDTSATHLFIHTLPGCKILLCKESGFYNDYYSGTYCIVHLVKFLRIIYLTGVSHARHSAFATSH